MLIIPVVDIKNGVVVHASGGNRSTYQPIESLLCSTSKPEDVIRAMIKVTEKMNPAHLFYIADLDAIESNGDNFQLISDLCLKFRGITFWIDAGFQSKEQLENWKQIPNIQPVIGSESHKDLGTLKYLLSSETILSLDFRNGKLLGPKELLNRSDLWPEKIIVMALDAVGCGKGVAHDLINLIRHQKLDNKIFAAGGVRSKADLHQLEQTGIEGVLLATALHTGKLAFH